MIVRLGGQPVTLDDVAHVARDGANVEVAPIVRDRLVAARAVVTRLASAPESIYGLNSALGANTGRVLDATDLAEYQRRAVRARAVGVGPIYDHSSVRAMMFARVAGMAAGGSGVSPHVFDALVAMLNRGVIPIVPSIGSISVADLPQLSHLALPLIGEGEAEFKGERLPGGEALRRAGLTPVALEMKDGIALISANAATIARAALVLHDLRALLDAWLATIALSYEGFRANLSPLDARASAARPAPGQADVATRLRRLLEGSVLLAPGNARRVQDPLSLRVVAQVHGAAHWMTAATCEQIELELNSAADSPLVVTADGEMLSTGNFHLPALATALDATAIALAQTASLAVERCIKFMAPACTDLPLQLTRHGPAHSGFATVQKTLTALWAGIRHAANPGSLDFLPVSDNVEDHATMALPVAEKLAGAIEKARYLVAIELLIAAQAVDLRALDRTTMGRGAQVAHERVRAAVPMLDVDRALGPDIDRIEALVHSGQFNLP